MNPFRKDIFEALSKENIHDGAHDGHRDYIRDHAPGGERPNAKAHAAHVAAAKLHSAASKAHADNHPSKADVSKKANAQSKVAHSLSKSLDEDKKGHFRSTESGAGMTSKGVEAYNKKTGGNLKTAVTGDAKPGSKAANRRKSFCARSRGWNGERGKAARRRWKC